jgi:hypothetical protein
LINPQAFDERWRRNRRAESVVLFQKSGAGMADGALDTLDGTAKRFVGKPQGQCEIYATVRKFTLTLVSRATSTTK